MKTNFKFFIANRGKSNAIARVRLTKAQFWALAVFMHCHPSTDTVPLIRNVEMTRQSNGWYTLWPSITDEAPTEALEACIRLLSRPLMNFAREQVMFNLELGRVENPGVRTLAFADGVFHQVLVEVPDARQKPAANTSVSHLAARLATKFRVRAA